MVPLVGFPRVNMFKWESNRLDIRHWIWNEFSVKQENAVIGLVLQIDVELDLRRSVIDDKPIESASCELVNLIESEFT